ncbi:PREDICTED: signal peptide peptidase-like 3, partial [Eurypyga helias]|uniref:signal peptide peptidase-like 3 n=1 Tax=Eurypyga helias TaxID=54383 RepID=UPI000528FD2D
MTTVVFCVGLNVDKYGWGDAPWLGCTSDELGPGSSADVWTGKYILDHAFGRGPFVVFGIKMMPSAYISMPFDHIFMFGKEIDSSWVFDFSVCAPAKVICYCCRAFSLLQTQRLFVVLELNRAYSLVDSSQVSTFLISILLIVYGSFRSLNMDFENQDKEKDSSSVAGSFNGNSTNNSIQTIDSTQALFLPIGASVSLLVMFFFFDSVQVVFTICTAVLATIAFAFLLLPMCQYLTRPCSPQNKISFGCCGRFTAAELLSFSLSVMLVLIWVLTGHWLLMD